VINKLKRLLKDSLIYGLGRISGSIISIFLVPIYTRIFSPHDYGIIDLIATVVAFLNLFLLLGIENGVARYYVDAKENKDKKLTASTGLFFITAFSFVVIPILILFSKKLSFLIFESRTYSLFLTVALSTIPFYILFYYFQNMLKWRFQPTFFTITSVGLLLLQTSLTVYLVVSLKIGIIGIYIAQLIGLFVFSIIGFSLTKSSYSILFSFKRLRGLLSFGTPYLPLSISYYIMTYSDRYFLRYFHGLGEVGLYGIGYKVASLITLLTVGFQSAWGPFVYSVYKDKDGRKIFSKVFDYFCIISCFAVLILSIFSHEILKIFATEKYFEAYKVIPFIAVSIVAYTLGPYFSIGIGISKRTIHKGWTGILAALMNIGLNILFIPHYGMIGAAIATILSFSILGVVQMLISQRFYPVGYNFKSNFIMYFIASLIIFIVYRFLPAKLTFTSIGLKFCLLMGFASVPFLLRLIGKKEIDYIKKMLVKT